MKAIQKLEQLDRLDRLVRTRATGTPGELAKRLGISRRSVFNLLESLKDLGAEIDYCKSDRCYFYKSDFKWSVMLKK